MPSCNSDTLGPLFRQKNEVLNNDLAVLIKPGIGMAGRLNEKHFRKGGAMSVSLLT